MEGCKKSGVIQYGYNMTEIEFEEDDSDLITTLIAVDNFGNEKIIVNHNVPTEEIPAHIYGYARFSYDEEDKEAFEADAQAYFDEHKQSSVNITVRFANLSDVEKYKQFLQLDDFEVGDKITIYHKDLDIYFSNLEIISKTFDVVAQRTEEIQIGSFKNAITRRAYMSGTVSNGDTPADKELIAVNNELINMTLRQLRTWGGASAYTWREVSKFTWEDVTKYVYNNN
jgi:phage-related protein